MNFKKLFLFTLVFLLLQGSLLYAQDLTDEEFLDMLERDSFAFFWNEVDPTSGLIKDSTSAGSPCSIAAVGFGLVGICIAEKRGWVSYEDAYERVLTTLKTFYSQLKHKNGFFYHFVDMETGRRVWNSEISSIDTAIFIAGALFCGEYFKDTKIERLADKLYRRINWQWMLNQREYLCMGWKPESGFLPYYWDSYNELILLYALAIGSPTHPIPESTWKSWKRPTGTYDDYTFVYSYSGSLFTYQYSHAWINFEELWDDEINYWDNSVSAINANRQFCIDNKDDFITYNELCWGLTACLGPDGYKAYGSEPGTGLHDGTIAPSAAGGSIPFAREASISAMRYMYDNFGGKLYGRYGFKDAFNLSRKWWADDYLGIDQGIIVLMIENARTGMVWEYFMKNEAIQTWIKKCMSQGPGISIAKEQHNVKGN